MGNWVNSNCPQIQNQVAGHPLSQPKTPSVREWVWIGCANAPLLDSDRLPKDQFVAFLIQSISVR